MLTCLACCWTSSANTGEALEKLKAQGKITLSPAHSTRLADRIAAKKASAKNQAKNSTAISRIRYEGALERALS